MSPHAELATGAILKGTETPTEYDAREKPTSADYSPPLRTGKPTDRRERTYLHREYFAAVDHACDAPASEEEYSLFPAIPSLKYLDHLAPHILRQLTSTPL